MYINFKQINQIENILNSITTSRTYLRNEVISYMDKILNLD